MKFFLLSTLALAACGTNNDRLTDDQAAAEQAAVEEAAAEQNAAINSGIAIARPPAPPVGVPSAPAATDYRAVGTEPGWALTVRGRTMIFQGDYGAVIIREPPSVGFRPAPGTYVGARISLTVTPGPCSDGMSDLIYRHTVRVVADGKAVNGCGGGTVSPTGLAGTNWRVTAINDRTTPGGAGYFLSFSGDALSARFGCNSIDGRYRVNGDHLSISGLTQTEMACPGPEAAFEVQGNAVLSSNMRIELASDERMRLIGEAGSINLRRTI